MEAAPGFRGELDMRTDMTDKYVSDMNPAELRAHMRRLKAMSGWHEPLADALYAEIQRMDAAAPAPSASPACQHDLRAEYEGEDGVRAAICAKCGERVQSASAEPCPECGNPRCFFNYEGAPCTDTAPGDGVGMDKAIDAAMSASKEGA